MYAPKIDWMTVALAILCLVIFSPVLVKKLHTLVNGHRRLPYPPGPKGWPILGSILNLPEYRLWEWAAEQAKTHGDLVFIKVLGKSMLFVNSYPDATELLEKKSAIYSSRTRLVFARELQGWDWMSVLMPYNEELRKRRAIIHRFTQTTALPSYIPLQMQAVYILLQSIVETPRKYDKHVRRFPGAIILEAAYGHRVASENDPLVELADSGIRTLTDAERLYMVDFFPWLKYMPEFLPGSDFKRRARAGYETARAMMTKPYAEAKKRYFEGEGNPCMVSQLIQENIDADGNILNEDVIASSSGMLYSAGQDTTTATIMTALLALTLYPEVQRKAQEELDQVIGKDTLPTFHDRKRLPYVNAVCAEALRWNTILPFGMPHCSTQNDNYKGYFIPAGTIVYPNIWAMSQNAREYPDPEKFDPERYLPREGRTPSMHPASFIFGFGRRSCPGDELAQSAVFLAISSILASFNVTKTIDVDGTPIEPEVVYLPPIIMNTFKWFECTILPRSHIMADLVQQLDVDVKSR